MVSRVPAVPFSADAVVPTPEGAAEDGAAAVGTAADAPALGWAEPVPVAAGDDAAAVGAPSAPAAARGPQPVSSAPPAVTAATIPAAVAMRRRRTDMIPPEKRVPDERGGGP